jgi:hypothetical protein
LFKHAVFAIGLALVAAPLAAAAQSAPDVQPSPLPAERFVMVDAAVAGKTYNELSNGSSTSGFGVRAAAEVPIVGHNWVAQIDYRSYNYHHPANGALPNGITFACPAGDPGCVTPIGYRTFNTVFTPGPVNYVNAFNAQDSSTQIGLGSKISRVERYYLSVGYMFRGFNYLGYPGMNGLGFGLDKLPDVDRALSVYGNFWAFFNVNGKYNAPSSAALGGFANYPFTVAYRMFTYRLGATLNIPHTPLFLDVSDAGDRADVSANGPSSSVHNALMIGVGSKF